MSDFRVPTSALPLQKLRVLEFTHAVMGPTAGLLLGDLGAEVIHVEPPGGDSTRRLQGFGTGYFPFYSRNKRSLAVDLKDPDAHAAVVALARTCDVVVENFGPGTMDRLGLGYEALSRDREDLIYGSLKGFLPGPYQARHAMDEVVQMMGGLAYMTGPPGQPLRAGTSVVDITGGMFGVIGILAALHEREATGRGQLVKAALFETTAFLMGQHMAYASLVSHPVPPMPARVSAWSIYQTFPTADDDLVFIGIISDKHWRAFARAFDRPDWLDDARLATNNDRIDARDWFLPDVEATVVRFDKAEVIRRAEAAGVPFAPIARPEDLFTDPQLVDGGALVSQGLPTGDRADLPRTPLDLGGRRLDLRLDPPTIGADTAALLREAGLDDDAIAALAARGAATVAPGDGTDTAPS